MIRAGTLEWNAANLTHRGFNRLESPAACRADMDGTGIRNKRVANMAKGWEEKIEKGFD